MDGTPSTHGCSWDNGCDRLLMVGRNVLIYFNSENKHTNLRLRAMECLAFTVLRLRLKYNVGYLTGKKETKKERLFTFHWAHCRTNLYYWTHAGEHFVEFVCPETINLQTWVRLNFILSYSYSYLSIQFNTQL